MLAKVILIIAFFCWAFYQWSVKQNEIDKAGLVDLNLQMVAVVDSIDPGINFHGYGIIRVCIISSNITHYDPRSSKQYYFCVIRSGMAELYTHTFVSKVDTLTIDTKRKRMFYKENGKDIVSSISISGDDAYYLYIRKHTIF